VRRALLFDEVQRFFLDYSRKLPSIHVTVVFCSGKFLVELNFSILVCNYAA